MVMWAQTTGCSAGHRYDATPALNFNELDYGVEVSTLDIEGVEVAFVDLGPRDAEALVLVHGLGENIGFWSRNLKALARERRVIALDLPGYGRSAKPERTYTMAYYADTLEALLINVGVDRAVLLGHSMGGQVALTYALRHKGRLAGLILAASAGIETFDAGEVEFLKNAVSTDLYMKMTEDTIRSSYQNHLFFEWSPMYEALVKQRVRLGKAPDFQAYAWAVVQGIHAMLDEPVFDRLGEIEVPTLVIYGHQDALIPNGLLHGGETRAIGALAVERMQDAELVMIDGTGHMLQYERPQRFNAVVDTWLKNKGM